jgi:hypothetical protein
VEVRKTQGFHPKMDFTYGPALPLGMEARREVLEFRSGRRLEAPDFLRRVNRNLPAGIRFAALERLPAGSPSLSAAISGLVYSVDRTSAAVGRAWTAAELRAALGRFGEGGTGVAGPEFALRGRRLVLTLPPVPARGSRAQDIVQSLFGVENAVFLVRRDEVLLRN